MPEDLDQAMRLDPDAVSGTRRPVSRQTLGAPGAAGGRQGYRDRELLGEAVNAPTHRRIGHGHGKDERADRRERGLGVGSWIVRPVDHGVREKRAGRKEAGGCPPIGEGPGMPCEGDAQYRYDGEQACLAGNTEMPEREPREGALPHQ